RFQIGAGATLRGASRGFMLDKREHRDDEANPGRITEMDRLGRQVVRAAGLTDAECEAAASSPLLYARIRAQIASQQNHWAEPYGSWAGIILAAWRALPVVAIIALVAAGLFWFSEARKPRAAGGRFHESSPEVLLPEVYSGSLAAISAPVSACSISAREE